ncbi:MAG: phosphatase PAP2 family protein, partial [Candidatus Rokuibacteriota bacterium]
LGGGLGSLMGFLILTAIVTQHRFDPVDSLARTLVQQSQHSLLRPVMEGASFFGGHPGQALVVVLGSAMLWRRRRLWALSLPVVMAGAGLIQLLAKWAVARPRPNLDPFGFPSAHVLGLVVLLGFVAYVVGMSDARRGWRGLGIGLCAATVGTVAYSRMYLDAHWFSDVLGGVGSGLAYLLIVIWLIRSIPPSWEATILRAAAGTGTEGLVAATTGTPKAGIEPGATPGAAAL